MESYIFFWFVCFFLFTCSKLVTNNLIIVDVHLTKKKKQNKTKDIRLLGAMIDLNHSL